MRIGKVTIKNFRSISPKGIAITFKNKTTLIGPNNAGKTNILDALSIILGDRAPGFIKLQESDFWDKSKPIEIEAHLEEITRQEAESIGFSGQRVAMICNNEPRNTIILAYYHPPLNGTRESLEEEEKEEKVAFKILLDKNNQIFQKIEIWRKQLITLITVPAVRTIGDQLRTSTWTDYGKLIRQILSSSEGIKEVKETLNKANNYLNKIFYSQKEQLLKNTKLLTYVDDISFSFAKTNEPEDLLENLQILVKEGDFETDLGRVGTGTQSSVILGILELCLFFKAKHYRLFAIEEPELYLHPHAQRRISDIIEDLSRSENTQIIITSHSPLFVDPYCLDSLCIVKKDKTTTGKYETIVIQKEIKDFVAALNNRGISANEDSFKQRHGKLMTVQRREGFFADRVVIVEGEEEEFSFPIYAKALGQDFDFDRANISVINAGGKAGIPGLYTLFNAFEIPPYVVFDEDKGKDPDATQKILLELSVEKTENGPKTTVTDKYTVFEVDYRTTLEQEQPLVKTYDEQAMKVLGYNDPTCGKGVRAKYIAEELVKKGEKEGDPKKYLAKTLTTMYETIFDKRVQEVNEDPDIPF